MFQHSVTKTLAVIVGAAVLGGCAYAPPQTETRISYALPPAGHGALEDFAQRVDGALAPDASAYWLLDRNDVALSARLALTDEATSTLDVQYFIWQDDATSRLLLRRLVYAADRGVRVRFLIDDLTRPDWDDALVALNQHPNIEIRVFNPWHVRWGVARFVEYLIRMNTLNHRMHNKAVIADNRFAIIGGRNIGNRYFGLSSDFVQNDLDMLIGGPLVRDISTQFDEYWNSDESYPLLQVVPERADGPDLAEITASFDEAYRSFDAQLSEFPLEPAHWDAFFGGLAESFAQGDGELYYDAPDIDRQEPTRLYGQFKQFVGLARREVLISSPYFIPDQEFVDEMAALVRRGVRVVVVTNSLASNNHIVAHTGYRHWRRKILKAGVELYEARLDAATIAYYSTPPFSGKELGLHTKAVVVDGRYGFVGSPNVDPRSMLLNTEMGVVVDDTDLAAQLRALILRDIGSKNSWRVSLTDDDWLHWTSDGETLTRQPARGFKQRLVEFFLNIMPLKSQG